MGRAAVEPHLHRLRVGSAEDHLADRRRLVVDVAEPRREPLVVEGGRAEQADLFLRREDELETGMRPALLDDPPRRVEHRRDRRLVVGAEDRLPCVRDDALFEHRLDRPLWRNRVEVRAEEDRQAAIPAACRLEPTEEVAGRRADARARVVLVHLEAELAQVERDAVCDLALLAGRARQRGEVGEELDDVGHRQIVESAASAAPSPAGRLRLLAAQ